MPETHHCPSRRIFYQCLLGVQYLHSQLVVHLDLKPDNILLVRESAPLMSRVQASLGALSICFASGAASGNAQSRRIFILGCNVAHTQDSRNNAKISDFGSAEKLVSLKQPLHKYAWSPCTACHDSVFINARHITATPRVISFIQTQ
jgi:serine/threonine protein kinase